MSIGSYILYLPEVALENIFSFLSYNEIAKCREVCKKFNRVCGNLLSRGFIQVEKRHSTIYKRMKTMLPRRESERRTHPLSRHCDILSAVETRISMLNMTFSRYIEAGLCHFFPGKVIDEIINVLNTIELLVPPPRTHELLQELRDISSMAMEHFEEFILPNLKAQIEQTSALPLLPPPTVKSNKFVLVQCSLADDIKKIKKQNKYYREQINQINAQLEKLNRREKRQVIKLKTHSIKIRDHERKLHDQNVKILEQEVTIGDLRKRIDEWEQKFADLTAEMRARDEFIEKPKESVPQNRLCITHNIKPRKAQVLLRPLTPIGEIERKRKLSLPLEGPSKFARSTSIKEEQSTSSTVKALDIMKELPNTTSPIKTNENNLLLPLKTNENNLLLPLKTNDETLLLPLKTPESTFLKRSDEFWHRAMDTLIKNPISSIKSRKRKMEGDINLLDL